MFIQLNGEFREVPDELDLKSLLDHLSMPEARIAVELNRQVVRKSDWASTVVKNKDRVEIVHFVGGG